MTESPLSSVILFHLGPVAISRPVVTTWALIAAISLAAWLVTRRLQLHPGRLQAVLAARRSGLCVDASNQASESAQMLRAHPQA